MLFNSFSFLVFFPVAAAVYFVAPGKLKRLWLLAASYYFYMSWNIKHVILIIFSTAVSWTAGLLLVLFSDCGCQRARKLTAAAGIVTIFSILFFFKYFNFAMNNISLLLLKAGLPVPDIPFEFALPAGISFYTFQSAGYIVDVYRKDIDAEKNVITYALFVSFFPQLVAGPIERSKNLLGQIRRTGSSDAKLFDYNRSARGLVLMLWGYFQKLVIADRIAVITDTVYDSWQIYGYVEIVFATAAFSIQIYCDFASYSVIAKGAAKVLGFELMDNFDTPYFSRSMREFWRRWHISLSTWFKDYLYIPLGGSRCGRLRQHRNTLITFLASGLWHGTSWHYAVWGAVHGIIQVIEAESESFLEKRKLTKARNSANTGKQNLLIHKSFSYRFRQTARTYIITLFTLIFFRAQSLNQAFGCIRNIFLNPNPWALTDGTLCRLGLDAAGLHVLALALAVQLAVSLIKFLRHETLDAFLSRQCLWFRWLVIATLFAGVFLYGIYGPEYDESQFIYFQF